MCISIYIYIYVHGPFQRRSEAQGYHKIQGSGFRGRKVCIVAYRQGVRELGKALHYSQVMENQMEHKMEHNTGPTPYLDPPM